MRKIYKSDALGFEYDEFVLDWFGVDSIEDFKYIGVTSRELRACNRAYEKKVRNGLRRQVAFGVGFILINVLVPTGAAVLFIPLGVWMLYKAFKKDIVIYP